MLLHIAISSLALAIGACTWLLGESCHQDDLDVEKERPVLNIVQIVIDALFGCPEPFTRFADLGPANHSWLDV